MDITDNESGITVTGKTHMLAGAAAATGVLYLTTGHLAPLLVVAGALGALFPDIDHPNSKLNRSNIFMTVFGWCYRLMLKVVRTLVEIPVWLLKKMGVRVPELHSGHRGAMTHGLLGLGIFAALLSPVFYYSPIAYWGLVIGVASHIFMDMLNPQGVPLLYPFYGGHIRLLPKFVAPTTGTWAEGLVQLSLAVLFFGLCYQMAVPWLARIPQMPVF